jgi:predicted aminopeptidase
MQDSVEKTGQKQWRDARKTIKKLKAEVRRKVKVLAGTTSLLVLSKKLEALYGEDPDSDEDSWHR